MNSLWHPVTIKISPGIDKQNPRTRFPPLQFPDKCSYCAGSSGVEYLTLKDKSLKRYRVLVPYCEKHAVNVRRAKILDTFTLWLGVVLGLIVGGLLHANGVLVIGPIGFNFIGGALIGLGLAYLVRYFIRSLFVRVVGSDKFELDENGAVRIGMVYSNAFVLLFHSKPFADEFTDLNSQYCYLPNSTEA